MTNEEPLPKKVRLSESDFKLLTREELVIRWKQYESYVQALESKYTDLNSNDVTGLRESEEKLKQQQQESARRENILVMRLATKEQEMQECTNQIQYLKQVQQPSVAQLRTTMVDPAINLFFLKMKGELEQTKDKLEQAQNELSAWKFTPDRGLTASDFSEEVATYKIKNGSCIEPVDTFKMVLFEDITGRNRSLMSGHIVATDHLENNLVIEIMIEHIKFQ